MIFCAYLMASSLACLLALYLSSYFLFFSLKARGVLRGLASPGFLIKYGKKIGIRFEIQ